MYHNDVKLSNIMVVSDLLNDNSSTLVKLADFGYATFTTAASNSLAQDVAMFKDTISVLVGNPYTEQPTAVTTSLSPPVGTSTPAEPNGTEGEKTSEGDGSEELREATLRWGHTALRAVIAAPTHPQGMAGVKEDLLILWRALRSKKLELSCSRLLSLS